MARLHAVKYPSPKAILPKQSPPKLERKESSDERVRYLELEKYMYELEARCSELNRQNESHRADIADWEQWYDKDSSAKEEIEELRKLKISNLVSINRLETENKSLRLQLSYAQDEVKYMKINKKAAQKPKPNFTRDDLSQENVDELFDKARRYHVDQIQPQASRDKSGN